jgi:hypothetical protein
MVRPTWVTVIGVLGIIFGCSGILGGGQQMVMPKMLAMQKDMFANMRSQVEQARKKSRCANANASGASAPALSSAGNSDASVNNAMAQAPGAPCQTAPFPADAFATMFQDMWNVPPWFATWLQVSGALRVLVGGFYLFAAIWFIQMKSSSIWLFSAALCLSILIGAAQFVAAALTGGLMAMAMAGGSSVGLVIDGVLLLVIWLSDRTVFMPGPKLIEPPPAAL